MYLKDLLPPMLYCTNCSLQTVIFCLSHLLRLLACLVFNRDHFFSIVLPPCGTGCHPLKICKSVVKVVLFTRSCSRFWPAGIFPGGGALIAHFYTLPLALYFYPPPNLSELGKAESTSQWQIHLIFIYHSYFRNEAQSRRISTCSIFKSFIYSSGYFCQQQLLVLESQ